MNLELQRRVGFRTGGATLYLPTVAGTEYRIRAMTTEDDQIPVTLGWIDTTPPNDDHGFPLFIGNGSGVVRSSNVSATEEAQEPDHAGVTTSTSVWFTFFATRTTSVTFYTLGSSFDTVIAAYDPVGALGSLNEIDSNDDAPGAGVSSEITINVTSGHSVIVAVDGFNGATGAIELHWDYPIPANDAFSAATNLAGAGGNGSGTTAGAFAETGEPNHAGVSGLNGTFASVWYDWTAPSSGAATFRTKDPRETDSTLAAYQGTAVNALFELVANDDTRDYQSGEDSEITFLAQSGQTYRIAVADEANPAEFGTPGDFSFDWAVAACGALPSDTPAWVSAAVNWATCLTFMTGYPDGTFRPDLNISRGQIASLLYRVAGEPPTNTLPGSTPTDVPSWLELPVRWLIDNGYATGYPDNTFRPGLPTTRAQVTRMQFRIAGSPSDSPTHAFSDVPAWIADAVNWIVDPANAPPYAAGYPDGTFRPGLNITRAQTTRMVCRIDTPPTTC